MESATTVAKSNTAKQITCNHCLARKNCLISTLNSTENSELSSIINHEKPMMKGQRGPSVTPAGNPICAGLCGECWGHY